MERDFVDWLGATLPPHPQLKIGVGDDAAVIAASAGRDTVVTTDLLADGTHFLLEETDPRLIGRKCLAVNLSDLAAMAAEPVAAFVSLLLPRDEDHARLARRLIEGMLPLAEQFGVAIAGGDTNTWAGRLAVSVTAVGAVGERGPLTRSGARPGDRLLVTGELGGSLEGHHLAFTPRVAEARALRDAYEIHAAMDLSDGLAVDLDRLTKASGVGAALVEEQIPASPSAERLALASGGEALDHALGDGEDFELLIAAPRHAAEAMLRDTPVACGLTEIGEVVAAGLFIESTERGRRPLEPRGYLHG